MSAALSYSFEGLPPFGPKKLPLAQSPFWPQGLCLRPPVAPTPSQPENSQQIKYAQDIMSAWAKPDPWRATQDRIRAIAALEPDWDGMGADAPSSAIFDGLIRYIQSLRERATPPPSRIAPTPLGTIILEWQSPGLYIEAEIVSSDRLEVMEAPEGRPIRHSLISF